MHYITLIFLLTFIPLSEALVFAGTEGEKHGGAIQAEWPAIDFNAAYDAFSRKDYSASSQNIRKGAAFLKAAADRSSGKIKNDLLSAYAELEKLAGDTENGKVESSLRLRKTFARAHNALAEYYHERLKQSWLRKDTEEAGRELKSAVSNLEHGIGWAGGEIEEKTEKVIKKSREIAEKMAQKSEWTADEVEKRMREVGEEINKLKVRIAGNEKTNNK
jgi:hypothetical protein